MRSFAVIAAISAIGAQALPEYYAAESSTPAYETTPAYAASTPAYVASTPAYPVASSSVKYEEYPASSSPAYAASTPVYSAGYPVSSAPGYPVASSSVKYEEYPVTSTKVVKETTFVCATPTVVTYEEKTYSVTKATTLTVSSYTTTVVKTTKTPEAEKPSSKPQTPVYSASIPPVAPSHAPYPSKNATVPHSAPQGTATGYPTSTKPSTPEFTGAAAQAGVGLLAVVGALAAFL
ncbi:hypothetical protein BU25DRAFT_488355 [Macroventuria anomochaeta]|uniref:Uncharacterized protein n=1 Tax=Macroventuria anomochaeta TaxID=301207 RepID=A0ACB6SEA6_9PLEO|nr:uncharacterized protein BU25DRAFT_488355 [Macroventuria anomochaeta]KAF2631812.1 hypothetical protein BU25DRAFT_488355 [Macroventuria anomochaeta]